MYTVYDNLAAILFSPLNTKYVVGDTIKHAL